MIPEITCVCVCVCGGRGGGAHREGRKEGGRRGARGRARREQGAKDRVSVGVGIPLLLLPLKHDREGGELLG